ncbi:MAG: hypothetical protein ABIG42_04605 [bacterium]
MKNLAYLFVILTASLLLTSSLASETDLEYVADGHISDMYTYIFSDVTFNGDYYYALYYINKDRYSKNDLGVEHVETRRNPEPTVLCCRKFDDGEYHCWYFQKLKINANRIIATKKYLICLDEMGQEVEIYDIGERGRLHLNEQASITNSMFDIAVEGEKFYVVER